MCGINGIYGLESITNAEAIVDKMNDRIAHRGPDADGLFTCANAVLGHRRLSIIDLHESSNQPFHSYDGRYTLVFNGEIYNFKELKAKFDDYPYKTSGDTEMIIAAYSALGTDCFELFNGMFALAIWDHQKEELVLARDRMGIKPLYYTHVNQSIVFSSEIRPIIHSGLIKPKLDQVGLHDYLRYQTVHAPNTIIEGVKMLLPGHIMRISDNEMVESRFWDIRQDYDKSVPLDADKVKKNIKDLLQKSVEYRTIADVPFGAFLSGGIDSSAIVGMMAQMNDLQINTFSVVFNEEEFSEAKYARMVANKFNTAHHEIKLQPSDFLDLLPDALEAMDHPSGDGPNTFVVSKVTKEAGVTMALSGLGGDELFAGYDLFKRCVSLSDKKWLLSFPKFLRKGAGSVLKTVKPGVSANKIADTLALDYFDLEYIYPLMRQVLLDKQILEVLSTNELHENQVFKIAKTNDFSQPGFDMPYLSRISYMEVNTYMQNVLLRDSDQMSMAHALEIRVPFLDHNLVEYVSGVHDKLKYPVTPKRLLIESLGDLLPSEIVNRPKMGFTFPWAHWMKNEMRDMCQKSIDGLSARTIFNGAAIKQLWQRFLKGDPAVSWSRVWYLIVLENWLVQHGVEA